MVGSNSLDVLGISFSFIMDVACENGIIKSAAYSSARYVVSHDAYSSASKSS